MNQPAARPGGVVPDAPSAESFYLPSPDFWRDAAPQMRGARYLSFEAGGTSYAVPLSCVREVDRVPPIAPLPNVPAWVLGAANLRGEVLSVVDLGAFLGLPPRQLPRDSRLLAVRAGAMEAGLLVERVREIRELPDAAIRPAGAAVAGRVGRFLSGVYAADGRLTLVLDVGRLLHSAEFRQFE